MILVVLVFSLLATSSPALALDTFIGKVVSVIDGDSIKVMHNGKAEQIRLNGIDCPEKRQAFGRRAKEATSSLVFGQEVTVRPKTTDKYGRTVAEVELPDGGNLNRELVKDGWCWWFKKYSPHDEVLKSLEAEAKKQKLGLWIDPNPVAPWDFRKAKAVEAAKKKAVKPSTTSNAALGMSAVSALRLPGAVLTEPSGGSTGEQSLLPILGNRRSHLYHRADCPNYSEIALKNQVPFASESEAQAAGYHIAGNCP